MSPGWPPTGRVRQTPTVSSADLPYLSAIDALAGFRSRNLSPVELLDALIEHIERREPVVNAVADRRYDEARAEARESERRYLGRGDDPRPLEGLPVAAKEEHPMTGRSWTQGSLTLAGEVAAFDHPIVERLQEAGAIIHIRTTTPEFCCAGFCHSRMWGTTRNPWNTAYTPGGSSGGSGAALAAGYAPLATGSDIGGSIRIPASFSGVVGFKPPFGRVPALPPYNLDQYCHDGPMARTVADCALMENVIAGPHWRDVASLRFPPRIPERPEGVAGMRIALCVRLGEWPLDSEVERNIRAVAEALAGAGAIVEEITLPWTLDQIWVAAQAHFASIMGAGIAHVAAEHGELLCDYTRAFAASMTSELGFYEGLELEGRLWEPLGRAFDTFDALDLPDGRHDRAPRRRDVPGRSHGWRPAGRQPHHGDDDAAVQPLQPLPGVERALGPVGQRRADRCPGRRSDLRRRDGVPGGPGHRGRLVRVRRSRLAARTGLRPCRRPSVTVRPSPGRLGVAGPAADGLRTKRACSPSSPSWPRASP